ncbi:MAG: FkbM family methyltransferase [Betaproteobacteria bacterium]
MSFVSHAQNYEDVMLWRALKDVRNGRYIDVGAQDPDVDSVTRAFYDRGWSGINIEPVAKYHDLLAKCRPRDVNLLAALGGAAAELPFFEIPDSGLSTLDPDIADRHRAAGRIVTTRQVRQRTLDDVWREHVVGDVHFLKIDAEGSETDVLRGISFAEHRPWIVLVEAVAPLSQTPKHQGWEFVLTDAGYTFAYFDGLNRFYVSPDKPELRDHFRVPPNFFDDFVRATEFDAVSRLSQRGSDSDRTIEVLASQVARIDAAIAGLSAAVRKLVDKPSGERDLLLSQVAYLGDHRALTYLQSRQKIFVDTRSVDIGSHLMLGGVWESHYADAFSRLLKPGDIVLDVGANHGVYSLLAAARVMPGGHVYAFEPSRNFYDLIKATVSINGLDAVVSVENIALGDADADVILKFNPHWSGRATIGKLEGTEAESMRSTETVRCVTLDGYMGDRLSSVDAIKMDIEGAEGVALKGMSKIVDRSPALKIMMEFCPSMMARFECDASWVVGFLKARDFMCWTIGDDSSLAPVRWEKLLEEPDRIRNVIASRRTVS